MPSTFPGMDPCICCYDTGPYRRRVVYDAARIVPPLDPERMEWAKQLLDQDQAFS